MRTVSCFAWYIPCFSANRQARGSAIRALPPARRGIIRDRTSTTPRGIPASPMSAFPELNVRTYVRVDKKPGVLTTRNDEESIDDRSDRRDRRGRPAQFVATFRPDGTAFHARRGSLEHFLR